MNHRLCCFFNKAALAHLRKRVFQLSAVQDNELNELILSLAVPCSKRVQHDQEGSQYAVLLNQATLAADEFNNCIDVALLVKTEYRCRVVRALEPLAGCDYSAVVGSMTEATSDTRFAGKPPCSACARTMSSFGAM